MSNQTSITDDDMLLVPFGAFGPGAAPLTGDYPVSTLIVGLGQVGWQAVAHVASMVTSSLAPKDVPHVKYLAIARRPPVLPENRLSRENLLLLSLEETDWAHIPGRYSGAGVARWWPKPPRERASVPDYTDIRAYGRLLMYENPALISDSMAQRTAALVQDSPRAHTSGRLGIVRASMAEAEGSGRLFDIAWLLRLQLLENPTTIVAMLTADTNVVTEDQSTPAVPNVYATLKELDALRANPVQFPISFALVNSTTRLHAASTQRPLDYLLVTGDAMKPSPTPSCAALADMATTLMLPYVDGSGPDLAPLAPPLGKAERFEGYTTFNVSKLGLPTAAAIDR